MNQGNEVERLHRWLSDAMHGSSVNGEGQICLPWLDIKPLEQILAVLQGRLSTLMPEVGERLTPSGDDALVERLRAIVQEADALWLGGHLDTISEAADALAALVAERDAMRALISEESIEALATDIAIACVDCRDEIREARHRAMVRLGKRLRKPLSTDLDRARSILNQQTKDNRDEAK